MKKLATASRKTNAHYNRSASQKITTTNPDTEKEYIGLCETTFKKRYANHKKSFNHEKYKNSTTLSTEFWRLKTNDCNPLISWKIIRTAPAFSLESGKCYLCLTEKFEIANFHEPAKLLNKRSEVISKCRHQRRFKLALFDTGDRRHRKNEDINCKFLRFF